jgi:NO-binding membrane sensor protein with MHYT domain
MPVVHQFTYGAANPVAGLVLSYLGSLMGLAAVVRARQVASAASRRRWLVAAATAIAVGTWTAHFVAMLGFDVPASPVRYDPVLTVLSVVVAATVTGGGLVLTGPGRHSIPRLAYGGLFVGVGATGMHYTGMAAIRLDGGVGYAPSLVIASLLIAVMLATAALWLTVSVRTFPPVFAAAGLLALAVCGMHYTGMAATNVTLHANPGPVAGLNPIVLVIPITLATCAGMVGLLFGWLKVSEDRFTLPPSLRPRPVVPTGSAPRTRPAGSGPTPRAAGRWRVSQAHGTAPIATALKNEPTVRFTPTSHRSR